jgi:predicted RNase H-like nuclease (RuvC/YqgF family)
MLPVLADAQQVQQNISLIEQAASFGKFCAHAHANTQAHANTTHKKRANPSVNTNDLESLKREVERKEKIIRGLKNEIFTLRNELATEKTFTNELQRELKMRDNGSSGHSGNSGNSRHREHGRGHRRRGPY